MLIMSAQLVGEFDYWIRFLAPSPLYSALKYKHKQVNLVGAALPSIDSALIVYRRCMLCRDGELDHFQCIDFETDLSITLDNNKSRN